MDTKLLMSYIHRSKKFVKHFHKQNEDKLIYKSNNVELCNLKIVLNFNGVCSTGSIGLYTCSG